LPASHRHFGVANANRRKLLQPTFKTLGIALDSRAADALIKQQPGAALQLLSQVRQAVKTVSTNLQVHGGHGRKHNTNPNT
jgi:hypothetical protein